MERPGLSFPSACLFSELTVELLDHWLASDGDVLSSSIPPGRVPHTQAEVLKHDFVWHLDVHFDSQAAERGESSGVISASTITSSIYGVPPVPEFAKRFNAQGLNTHVGYEWANRNIHPSDSFHLLFKTERSFQLDEPISRADVVGLVGGLVDDTCLGTLATGMKWIFSRSGAL
jgi:hypothetical protein